LRRPVERKSAFLLWKRNITKTPGHKDINS
jgi:hypothetical protein